MAANPTPGGGSTAPVAGPYSGSVTLKDKAGIEEAALLSVRAMQEAAYAIVESVAAVSKRTDRIVILSPQDVPNGGRLAAFRFELSVLADRLRSACPEVKDIESTRAAAVAKSGDGSMVSLLAGITPALVSTQLNALNDLLGFFKSDYNVGSIDTAIDDTLVKTVAGSLVRRDRRAFVPALLHRTAGNASVALNAEMSHVFKLRDNVIARQTALTGAKDPESLAEAQAIATAVAAFDSYVTSLTAPGQNGVSPINQIVDDLVFERTAEAGDLVLLVHVENCGGSFYDKKGLIAGIFGMPIYFAGGTTISYVLSKGGAGDVLGAGAVPVYGGFVKADRLREALQGPIPPDPPLFQRLW